MIISIDTEKVILYHFMRKKTEEIRHRRYVSKHNKPYKRLYTMTNLPQE
jgi:hypothetical protein